MSSNSLHVEVDQLQLPDLDQHSPALYSTWWLPGVSTEVSLSPLRTPTSDIEGSLAHLEPDEVWDVINKVLT
eukprot:CAMPEP_0114560360 /NCGR_PEP_ID=MMETSP0114-20121206/11419_1 /TAXON_ID=31324 /ORGANISM="Goniomonas sp, Strain m" /LENGTH=71 /DNA_ID=CAMNT_0001745903 /DNA_START=8 /DNA_END=223 /DNA_ORIENTATION=-